MGTTGCFFYWGNVCLFDSINDDDFCHLIKVAEGIFTFLYLFRVLVANPPPCSVVYELLCLIVCKQSLNGRFYFCGPIHYGFLCDYPNMFLNLDMTLVIRPSRLLFNDF